MAASAFYDSDAGCIEISRDGDGFNIYDYDEAMALLEQLNDAVNEMGE